MRVAIDCRLMYYRKAGISNYTRRLVQALAAHHASDVALQLHILLDRRDTDTAWAPDGVKIIRTVTPAHHAYEHITLPLELSIFNFQFSILHSPDFIACPGRFRKVITIHDLYFMEHPEVMSADGRRYYSRVRRSARMADRIITPSHFTRGDVLRLLPDVNPDHVHVVHEAADELKIVPIPLPAKPSASRDRGKNVKLKTTAGYPSNPSFQFSILNSQFLLFVGTLEPRKNLVTLLRALSRLPDEVRLTVVGAEGWAGTEPGELARELGVSERVTLAGWVSDAELDALYRGARAFAMPSLSEGFGLPVLEAMAHGAPVVCSNSGSLPEIASDDALFHDPLDDATLAQHLLALWRDDAVHDDFARRGLARAAQFSWQQAASETLDVYRAALGRSDQ